MSGAIRYSDSLESVSESDLHGFFVGWPNPPSPEVHLQLLAGSQHRILAMPQDSSKVLGFITALSDGVLSAYIPFLEVLPSYQGQGIGLALCKRMFETLRSLYVVDLVCDPQLQPFYEKLGMQAGTGMMARNYAMQSGVKS